MMAWRTNGANGYDPLESEDIHSGQNKHQPEFREGRLVYLRPKSILDDPEPAMIKYCGAVPELGPGTFFGVEILVESTQGMCDGSMLGKRYFTCQRGAGTFVKSSRLIPYQRASKSLENGLPSNGTLKNNHHSTTLVLHLKKNNSTDSEPIHTKDENALDLIDMRSSREHSPITGNLLPLSPPSSPLCPFSPSPESDPYPKSRPLKVGDRVVWISDIGPEKGSVRWLGVLPGSSASAHPMAGVEFDNPVGTGTGLYQKHQLFVTRKRHASFIPLLGLIRAEDFCSDDETYDLPKPELKSRQNVCLLADEKYATHSKEASDCNGLPALINNLSTKCITETELRTPILPPSPDSDLDGYYTLPPTINDEHMMRPTPGSPELGVGSVVEVAVNGQPRYGVIRWAGYVPEDRRGRKVAGVEMEEDLVGGTDGTFNNRRYFKCAPRRALFVGLSQCRKDARFQESMGHNAASTSDHHSGVLTQPDCPIIPGFVRPLGTQDDIQAVCGKFRGIQGHHNSCYLDATLFSMFAFTSVFDSLLFRPPTHEDGPHYLEVQRVLREEIVNPLRSATFVRADRVMRLRTLLDKLGSVTGMTSEEKDPEELLTSLVAQTLRAEPLLKLSSGQEALMHQLFVEKDERLELPSVQQLFEQSFLSSNIKLKEVPPCLIIQMPRFGKAYKMYPRILPSQILDVTDVIENSPRQCIVCGKLAVYECRECFGQCGAGLESIAFCEPCLETAHSHQRRQSHAWRQLTVPQEYIEMLEDLEEARHHDNMLDGTIPVMPPIPRIYMELFAVVCIETSHYVAFVKAGSGPDAPWVFFDSMADRRGEQNGFNIPEVSLCPELPHWLSEQGARGLPEVRDERQLPERAKRLLCDAYMCFYQSPDVAMYN